MGSIDRTILEQLKNKTTTESISGNCSPVSRSCRMRYRNFTRQEQSSCLRPAVRTL